jgi:hypothetical protein
MPFICMDVTVEYNGVVSYAGVLHTARKPEIAYGQNYF